MSSISRSPGVPQTNGVSPAETSSQSLTQLSPLSTKLQTFWGRVQRLRLPVEWVSVGGVVVLFAVPFSVAIAQLLSELNASIVLAQRERAGVEYSVALKTLLEEYLSYRRLVNTNLTGLPVSLTELERREQAIAGQVQVINQLNQQWGSTFQTTSGWQAVRSRWEQLSRTPIDDRLLSPSVHSRITPLQELTEQMTDLLREVGQSSNLTADPEPDNYYLVNTLVVNLPVALNALAQAEEAGMQAAGKGKKTAEERFTLTILSNTAREVAKDIRRDIRQIIALRPRLRVLETAERRSSSATQLFYDTFERRLIQVETVTFTPSVYSAEAKRAIDAQFDLYDAIAPQLDRLLQQRIARLSQRRVLILGFGGGFLTVSAIATFAFVRNLRRRRQAEQSLQQAHHEISQLNQQLQSENLRMGAELSVARQLQQMILPKTAELKAFPQLDMAGYMAPAAEVGGDYYDVLHQDGRIKIGIGDVTGHGLESGMVMLMAQTAVRTLLNCNETDPARFLDVLNRTLYHNVRRMDSGNNMTLSLLDYDQGCLRFYGQHESLIWAQANGKLELIDTADLGFPVALTEDIAAFVASAEIHLEPEDVVVLYTDGITEAENSSRQLYGLERLCEVVQQSRDRDAETIKSQIIEDVQQHIGNQHVFDDITLVVLKQR